ncbi:unnamed protein product [Arabidopsis halleri]
MIRIRVKVPRVDTCPNVRRRRFATIVTSHILDLAQRRRRTSDPSSLTLSTGSTAADLQDFAATVLKFPAIDSNESL